MWKSLSRVRLCDPMDSTVREVLQARILKWVAVPSPGNLPEPRNPTALQVDSLSAELPRKPPHTVDK